MSINAIIQVAVPSPLRRIFDYLPNAGLSQPLQPGMRVKVPFGRKYLIGVVVKLVNESALPHHKLKAINTVIDSTPLFSEKLFKLLCWAADYYQYPLGEVLQQAMPVLLRQGKVAKIREQRCWYLTKLGAQIESNNFKRAPKQWQTLHCLREHLAADLDGAGVSAAELSSLGILTTQLKKLEIKKLVVERKVNKINVLSHLIMKGPPLNAEQQTAVEHVLAASHQFKSFLLQGITGSGKTEVYLAVLEKVVANGGQALVLVPEIGLTPQTVARFRERLHCQVALLHSGLTDGERLDTWLLAKNAEVSVIIGTRSAIFTPFRQLKCIIVDESHDASYKQWDGFKYNARDLAVRRAQLNNIPVLLGSATPSLASLQNAIDKKFSRLTLSQRATGASLPIFHLLDSRKQKLHHGIAESVLQRIKQHLELGNQIFLFINRRGFAPVVMCHECGFVAECDRCHASLTKHFSPLSLQCHHCGKHKALPSRCSACDSSQLLDVGLGTQRVEQILQTQFPHVTIERIDRDSTRKKGTLHDKLQAIHRGHAQIMIGTQMLAKGHHFPNVTLVVMLGIDGGLYSADFNASEQMAQLLLQVAGRAGREQKPGEVIVQTHHPDHPLLQTLVKEGYAAFAEQLLEERRETQLPPFYYIALFRVEAITNEACEQFLTEVKMQLVEAQAEHELPEFSMFGPLIAPIEKRAGRFRWQLVLSASRRKLLNQLLRFTLPDIETLKTARKVRWSLDIDPINTL